MNNSANFLFEAGALADIPRSGFTFTKLGIIQSVAEHTNLMCYIVTVLHEYAQEYPELSLNKMLFMALFHDFTETRISDLHHVNKEYVARDEEKAMDDQLANMPPRTQAFVKDIMIEYEARESMEAKLVKDADTLEFIIQLRPKANNEFIARDMLERSNERVITAAGRKLLGEILNTEYYEWWKKDLYR